MCTRGAQAHLQRGCSTATQNLVQVIAELSQVPCQPHICYAASSRLLPVHPARRVIWGCRCLCPHACCIDVLARVLDPDRRCFASVQQTLNQDGLLTGLAARNTWPPESSCCRASQDRETPILVTTSMMSVTPCVLLVKQSWTELTSAPEPATRVLMGTPRALPYNACWVITWEHAAQIYARRIWQPAAAVVLRASGFPGMPIRTLRLAKDQGFTFKAAAER